MNHTENASVIILAGGLGTRVRALYPHLPKPMIPVAGHPFIEWVIQYFMRQGLRRFVISLGYLSHIAEDYFRQRPGDEATIITICESAPLGTGGALLMAAQQAISDPLIVANGDSLVLADLSPVLEILERPEADGVLLGVLVEDTSRYGALKVATDGKLLSFQEKWASRGLINAGVYSFKRRILKYFPEHTPLSLETDVFPALLERRAKIFVCSCDAPFLDIGSYESLQEAERFIERYFSLGGRR